MRKNQQHTPTVVPAPTDSQRDATARHHEMMAGLLRDMGDDRNAQAALDAAVLACVAETQAAAHAQLYGGVKCAPRNLPNVPAPQTPHSGVPSADGVAARGAGQVVRAQIYVRVGEFVHYARDIKVRPARADESPFAVVADVPPEGIVWAVNATLTDAARGAEPVDTDEDFDADEQPVCDCDREARYARRYAGEERP